MAASSTQSRGGGTILLVLFILIGIAGASAFFIHSVLTAKDTLPPAVDQPEKPKDPDDLGPPIVLTPSIPLGQDVPSPAVPPLPSGQFVAPPADVAEHPSREAEILTAEISNQIPSSSLIEPMPHQVEPRAEIIRSSTPDPAPNLLLVPGTIEPPPPAAREDAVVRPDFINDIAGFLAKNYWPKNTHPSARNSGITTASLQWANLRYGADLRGADGSQSDSRSARRAVLNYVLKPMAVDRIYSLYADGFIAALKQEADKRTVGEGNGKRLLSEQEKKEMFGLYANFAVRIAGALESYAADPTMPTKVQTYSQAEQAVQEANRIYLESMVAHEDAAESKDKARVVAAQLRMDKDAATYQKRVREREATRDVLIESMGKMQKGYGDDTLVYTAFWAYRRGKDSASSLRACSKALNDMGAKLAAAARK